MKKTIALLIGSLALSGIALASPAHADAGNPFDVYGLSGPGFHVNSGSCRHVPISASVNAPADYQDISAEVDVWRGNSYLGTADLSGNGASHRLTGSYYYCPNLDPVGTYRLGDTEVSWAQYDDDFNYYNSGDFTDRSRGSVVVKQATRIGLTGRKQGKVRKFQAVASYFGAGGSGWYRFPKGTRLALQRHTMAATGPWTRVKVAKTSKKGLANFRVKPKAIYRYRVVSAGTTRSWAGISRAIAR